MTYRGRHERSPADPAPEESADESAAEPRSTGRSGRRGRSGRSGRPGRPSRLRTGLTIAGAVLGFLAFLLIITVGARQLSRGIAPTLVTWADGDQRRLVAFVVVIWALLPPLVLGAVRLSARRGRLVAAPLWLLAGLDGLLAFGFTPGKNDDGQLARQLDEATGSGLGAVGDVLTGASLAGLIGVFVIGVGGSMVSALGSQKTGSRKGSRKGSRQTAPSRRSTWRTGLGVVLYVGAWVAVGAIAAAAVDASSASRGDWLADSARALRGGDAGVTGGFDVGLDPSVVEVVDCDTAAGVLRVDGDAPALDGCRQALLVAATGRYDLDGVRTSSGALTAVVVQVRTEDEVADLADSLDGAELEAGSGLPAPTGTTLVGAARAALAVVVSAEDPGAIPLPSEGAGRRPLSRALAYVVIGSAVGLYVAPPSGSP